jgi:hypothetical protein
MVHFALCSLFSAFRYSLMFLNLNVFVLNLNLICLFVFCIWQGEMKNEFL